VSFGEETGERGEPGTGEKGWRKWKDPSFWVEWRKTGLWLVKSPKFDWCFHPSGKRRDGLKKQAVPKDSREDRGLSSSGPKKGKTRQFNNFYLERGEPVYVNS